MDRTLELLRQLAQELLVHSKFEPFVPGYRAHPIDALKTLGKLEQTTQQSMAPFLKKAEAARLQSEAKIGTAALAAENDALAVRSPGTRGEREPSYFEARNEYKPALKDPGVIQALLDFHQSTAPALASRSGKSQTKSSKGSFSPAKVQQVDTAPKPKGLNPRTPGTPSSTVLRKK